MNNEELWEVISPLIKKRYITPDFTDVSEYKKYYEAACIVGERTDKRYPNRWYDTRGVVEEFQFKNKHMWKQGNRQSLTYRSNRLSENLLYIIRNFKNAGLCNYLWEVQSRWENIGWILASNQSGAEQMAHMMYSPIVPIESLQVRGGSTPVWDGEQEIFTEAMNDCVLKVRSHIEKNRKRIKELNESIEGLQTQLEFLTLNMMAFNEKEIG
ncbi:MAG: hypothetical protein CBC29_06930 [Methylococcaceae bacterium TMED69]|nr:MAG: hypothetical protein CBC29_06930 [Methylococcaceae bacterium TMED69]